jgi:hypothetical protein
VKKYEEGMSCSDDESIEAEWLLFVRNDAFVRDDLLDVAGISFWGSNNVIR